MFVEFDVKFGGAVEKWLIAVGPGTIVTPLDEKTCQLDLPNREEAITVEHTYEEVKTTLTGGR